MLRDNVQSRKSLITPKLRKDLVWFNQFLSQYKGVTYNVGVPPHDEGSRLRDFWGRFEKYA